MPRSTNIQAISVVVIQFATAGWIVVGGPIWPPNLVARIALIASLLLGFWAIWSLKIGYFNVRPTVHRHAQLVTNGPYRWIRHPMYLAVLVFIAALVVSRPTWIRVAIWIVLWINLLIKIRIEERLLTERIEGYAKYAKKTGALVPRFFSKLHRDRL